MNMYTEIKEQVQDLKSFDEYSEECNSPMIKYKLGKHERFFKEFD